MCLASSLYSGKERQIQPKGRERRSEVTNRTAIETNYRQTLTGTEKGKQANKQAHNFKITTQIKHAFSLFLYFSILNISQIESVSGTPVLKIVPEKKYTQTHTRIAEHGNNNERWQKFKKL